MFYISAACCLGGNIEVDMVSWQNVSPTSTYQVHCNIMVNMPACRGEDPGSIPRGGLCFEVA